MSELVESFGGGQYETIADLPKADFLYNLWWVGGESIRGNPECKIGKQLLSTLLPYLLASTKYREETFNFTKSAVCKGPENYNEIALFGM